MTSNLFIRVNTISTPIKINAETTINVGIIDCTVVTSFTFLSFVSSTSLLPTNFPPVYASIVYLPGGRENHGSSDSCTCFPSRSISKCTSSKVRGFPRESNRSTVRSKMAENSMHIKSSASGRIRYSSSTKLAYVI